MIAAGTKLVVQNFRRPCIRWEQSTTMFRSFLYLG